MNIGTADRVTFNISAQIILRVLIASYFLAVALNLIPGTDLGLLFASVLPAPYAAATAAGVVFICAFMIMIGMATRSAALLLAIMTFFASYLTMVNLGVQQELGAFWRDLALIAALLLTYGDSPSDRRLRRRIIRRTITPRRIVPNATSARQSARPETPSVAMPQARPERVVSPERLIQFSDQARKIAASDVKKPVRIKAKPVEFTSIRRLTPSDHATIKRRVHGVLADRNAYGPPHARFAAGGGENIFA